MPGPLKKGWYSRGYLPHFDGENKVQFVTFRVYDSLPVNVVQRMQDEVRIMPESVHKQEARKRAEVWLDRGYGSCWLLDPVVAEILTQELWQLDGEDYMLLGWCIMPNHVHVVCELSDQREMWKVIKRWKAISAQQINKILNRPGAVWYREYFDRFIRTDVHLQSTLEYVHQNPVRAKLCRQAEKWRFSSAWRPTEEE